MWGTSKLQFSEGFQITWRKKRNVLDVSGVLYNCIFLAPHKEPTAESGLFWTNFKKLKQRLKKKKNRGQSVYLVQTDGCIYVVRLVMQKDFQSSTKHTCQENASGWQKVETLYWVNI